MQSVFTALKQGTHSQHVALENTYPFSLYQTNSAPDKAVYLDILNVMLHFHKQVGVVIEVLNTHSDIVSLAQLLNQTSVVAALEADIKHLEAEFHAGAGNKELHSVFNQEFTNVENTPSVALSAMYVWLGSSMGANVLLRRLKSTSELPVNYYSAMAECARAWVEFKQQVDSLLPSFAAEEDNIHSNMLENANRWFAFLICLGEQVTPVESC
ncbi:MAG: biliverdin-producing heme oxygenase [Pseudomonadota bacterium]|nr:biliverdin-producing heme oxygenase [Pseudomonadota bacterium]